MKSLVCAIFLAASVTAPSTALALEWSTTAQKFTTTPLQSTQEVVFSFKNDSQSPVKIKDVETSCSCLTAKADRVTYGPGETGKITAVFTIGDRAGLYERTIWVVTDEPTSPAKLRIELEVPPAATPVPRSVQWMRHEAPAQKAIELTVAPELEIKFTSAIATDETFSVSLVPVEVGRKYRVLVQPHGTEEPRSIAVRITGRDKSGREIVESVYLSVN